MILLIRTSSGPYGVALYDDQTCVAQRETALSAIRNRNVADLFAQMMQDAGHSVRAITQIGVDLGPGGLSSARAGVSFANALAYASGAELWGVDALDLQRYCCDAERVLSLRPAPGQRAFWRLYAGDQLMDQGCDPAQDAIHIQAPRADIAIGPMQRFPLHDPALPCLDLDPPRFEAFFRAPRVAPIGDPAIVQPITDLDGGGDV